MGGKGFGPLEGIKKHQRADVKKGADKASTSDQVSFSSVLQNASQTQQTASTQSSAHADKLQTLKDQIASGQYRPDLEKVAASMLKFLVEDQV
jgi:negative regulator of flagellin synthesis FlgM